MRFVVLAPPNQKSWLRLSADTSREAQTSRQTDHLLLKRYTWQWRSVTFQIRHAVMMTSSVLMTSLLIRQ